MLLYAKLVMAQQPELPAATPACQPLQLYCCRLLLQLWGLLIGAPSAHFWHMYLQRWFAGKAETLQTVLQKVALDQLTFGPLYNLAFMAYTSMVVNGE